MRKIGLISLAVLLFGVNASCAGLQTAIAKMHLYFMNAKDYFEPGLQVELAQAVARGNVARIDELVKKGADVNARGRDGATPLFWAVLKQNKDGFQALLEHGADLDVMTKSTKGNESSVLQFIATMGDTEYLRLALQYGGNPNASAGGSETIIYDAIVYAGLENVKVLVEAGADVNCRNIGGKTPVMLASDVNKYDIVYYLLTVGADPNVKNVWGTDLVGRIKMFGSRGIEPGSEQHNWYLKVLKKLDIQENDIRQGDATIINHKVKEEELRAP